MRIYPSEQEFIQAADKGVIIPLVGETLADIETPVSAFMKIRTHQEYAYLLESVEIGEKLGRYSFVGVSPSVVIASKGRMVTVCDMGNQHTYQMQTDPLDEIKRYMHKYTFVLSGTLPRFCGGFVGYMGYDVVRFFEKIPDKNPDTLSLEDMVFMLNDTLLVFDNIRRTMQIVVNVKIEKTCSRQQYKIMYKNGVRKVQEVQRLLRHAIYPCKTKQIRNSLVVRSNFTKETFARAVKKIKEYIKKGDIIQAVFSQRFETDFHGDSFYVYRALRSINPSPYMFYLKLKDTCLVGSSPEILVRCEDRQVQVRPIAGTRPRGKNEGEDNALEQELLRDPKEIAEHVMLVDLGRNDIGRVCDYGTVQVREKMAVQRYSHVMHIESECVGRLSSRNDCFDLLRATFPAGTVSGAPKIRAMEIIDEVENRKRGVYAGCVGYFSFQGNMDMCITIRTIVIKGNKAYIQAGAGIVADSDPMKECQESQHKAKALFKALEMAGEIE